MNVLFLYQFTAHLLADFIFQPQKWCNLKEKIAAKSILRFRDLDTAKTEYVLIGSLLSFGIAIFFGIAYQLIH